MIGVGGVERERDRPDPWDVGDRPAHDSDLGVPRLDHLEGLTDRPGGHQLRLEGIVQPGALDRMPGGHPVRRGLGVGDRDKR